MVKVLVDYSYGHTEQLSTIVEKLNASYEGYPILFQVSWNNGRREGLQLYIEFEYKGERGFTSLSNDRYPAEQILTDWPDIKHGLDYELGLTSELGHTLGKAKTNVASLTLSLTLAGTSAVQAAVEYEKFLHVMGQK